MCEISTVLIGVAAAGIIGAIVSIGVAIALNNGFFTAPSAPAAMIAAGIASGVAAGALLGLSAQISDYYQCMGSPQACAGDFSNAMNAVNALITTLFIQAAACFVAAGIAWIPWAGAAPMYVILASLIAQSALIPSLYVFLGDLVSCANDVATEPAVGVITAGVVAVAAISIVLTAYVRRNLPWRWKTPKQ